MTSISIKCAIAASFIVALPLSVSADDIEMDAEPPKVRGEEVCANVGFISEYAEKFAKLDADETDTVQMLPQANLILEDASQSFPQRFFYRDGGQEVDLTIAPDGQVTDFAKMLNTSEAVELCSFDPARAGVPYDEDGIELDMDMDIQYLNRTGYHTMEEIKDGLKDGKKHYKKMAGLMSFMVPKMTYVMVEYVDKDQALEFAPMTGDQVLPNPETTDFCDLPMIKVEDLEALGADGLRINGGAYTLLPVPDVDTLEKFAKCDGEDEEG